MKIKKVIKMFHQYIYVKDRLIEKSKNFRIFFFFKEYNINFPELTSKSIATITNAIRYIQFILIIIIKKH